MNRVIRTCALGVGVAAMFAASTLSAASFENRKVNIPFEFHVAKLTMPAGDYRLQEVTASGISYLVNVKTGQQVQMLRSAGARNETKVRLVFETNANGYTLKGIN